MSRHEFSLDQLRTFVTAAETLNFTQAARQLHLSQAAVSQQVRDLEHVLQVTLFERRGRGLGLTPGGERFRALASEVLHRSQRAIDELAELRGVPQGVLYVGAESTPGVYVLPHALGAFSSRFPGVQVSLRVAEADALVGALQQGLLDTVLLEEPLPPRQTFGWEQEPFLEEELVIAVRPEHPWAALDELELAELGTQPFILRQPTSSIRRTHGDSLAQAGFDPSRMQVRFELGSTEGIKHAVLAGLGVGFVPRCAMAVELKANLLSAVRLRGLRIVRSWWLLRPSRSPGTLSHQRFQELLRETNWLPPTLGLKPLA